MRSRGTVRLSPAIAITLAFALALALALALTPPSRADERSDLSLAIRQGNLAAVRTLVEKNPALVKTADDAGYTPLHIAAIVGRLDIIEYLLSRGADMEARTPAGQTPLFQTVPLCSDKAFAYLLDKGANLSARDDEGKTILEYALSWRRAEMAQLILSKGFALDAKGPAAQKMLEEAADAGLGPLVDALAAKGTPVTTGKLNGTTLLHCAARGGLPAFAERLLKLGAKVDERDEHGLTPMHLAAFYGRDEVVAMLAAHGADLDARGLDGRSAWNLAEYGGHPATMALLASKGAKAGPPVPPVLAGPYLGQPEPGKVPRIFAPGVVSSEEHETNIAFAPDGREISFSRINPDQTRRWILFMRLSDGRWGLPELAPFLSGGTDFEVSYSADGRQLFFVSDRPLAKGGPAKRDTDVWVVERTGGGWGEPRNLGPAVNGPSNEYMPSADREGNLYFDRYGLNVARRKGGDYVQAEKAASGVTNVINLGHPFIAPDASYLLFDGRVPGSGKGLLYASYPQKGGGWSQAVRLFPGAEPRDYESCPTVSPDGKFLFFGRDHDIYWVSASVIEESRPKLP